MHQYHGKPSFKGIYQRALLWSVVIVSVFAVLFVPVAEPVQAASNNKVAYVVSHYSSSGPTIGTHSCPVNPDAVAVIPMKGTMNYGDNKHDTLKGTGEFTSCVYMMADGSSKYSTNMHFEGDLKRCGQVSFDFTIKGTNSAPDPQTGEINTKGYWKVTNESNTIQSGTGYEISTTAQNMAVNGLLNGVVVCK